MTTVERAWEIMGKNFLGTEEAQEHFGVAYTDDQLRSLADVPFCEETLRSRQDTHVLFAGAQLSVNEVRKIAGSDFYGYGWYAREPFANDRKADVRWHLVRKEPVPESCSKTYDQQAAVMKNEEVPFACEVAYMAILYRLARGHRLLPDVYVRCQDKDSGGNRVVVGNFDSDGFDVSNDWDDRRDAYLGLASSVIPRKS